jgi:hypothetical protein
VRSLVEQFDLSEGIFDQGDSSFDKLRRSKTDQGR